MINAQPARRGARQSEINRETAQPTQRAIAANDLISQALDLSPAPAHG